jgi:hypothetical protein
MHFNFPFTVGQVLWTLTFAAQLTLLVVLLGRDRIKRYPWFTASIVLFALRLLVEVLLSGRLAALPLRATFIALADLMALVGLLVVIEVARRAFADARRRTWVVWTVAVLAVAVGVLATWGPWPGWKDLTWDSPLAVLRLMQLVAQKTDLLVDLLTVEVGLLVLVFGRHFKAGWRSHTQQIAIGLSTVAIGWLAVQGMWQIIATTVHPHTQQEYERVIGLGSKLVNGNKVVYLAVLVWWIVCLWFDEPGRKADAVADATVVGAPEGPVA